MTSTQPFMLMIAGPNGSGKTTLTDYLRSKQFDFGEYINPDEIALTLPGTGAERTRNAQRLADERRSTCLVARRSFSFETVMSHPSKLDVLREARQRGFKVLLFFVATSDPQLNLQRVRQRILLGGHSVPEDKILARYERTLGFLPEALGLSDEALLFDNSRTDVYGRTGLRLILRYGRSGYSICTPGDVPTWAENALQKVTQKVT